MKVLDKSWIDCLRIWKWITENLPDGFSETTKSIKDFIIESLKRQWLRENNFTKLLPNDCFFCAFDQNYGDECNSCPARLVEKHFHCTASEYNYAYEPEEFYNLLVKLDKKRRGA
ncbi:hypothetical protein LCGC14_1365870 [marine sediment metagenome]|uniref:Uncharacterized protein n=1 Tax=marine sediment metagenome TaxID=412755 RepID=A0A0F9N8X9_9ZZZZ